MAGEFRMPVVVFADDLDKMLRAYIASGRNAENARECDPAWDALHNRLKAVKSCPSVQRSERKERVMAAKGKPAVVRVEAQCGHDDTYYLAPGETMTIKGGWFTFCLACNEKADVHVVCKCGTEWDQAVAEPGAGQASPGSATHSDGLPATMLRTVPIDDEPDPLDRTYWPESAAE